MKNIVDQEVEYVSIVELFYWKWVANQYWDASVPLSNYRSQNSGH